MVNLLAMLILTWRISKHYCLAKIQGAKNIRDYVNKPTRNANSRICFCATINYLTVKRRKCDKKIKKQRIIITLACSPQIAMIAALAAKMYISWHHSHEHQWFCTIYRIFVLCSTLSRRVIILRVLLYWRLFTLYPRNVLFTKCPRSKSIFSCFVPTYLRTNDSKSFSCGERIRYIWHI